MNKHTISNELFGHHIKDYTISRDLVIFYSSFNSFCKTFYLLVVMSYRIYIRINIFVLTKKKSLKSRLCARARFSTQIVFAQIYVKKKKKKINSFPLVWVVIFTRKKRNDIINKLHMYIYTI
jgi:hypothetical protein